MRKLLLGFVSVALLAGLLAWAVLQKNSYLLIAIGNYTLEMSLWTALLLMLAFYLLVRLLVSFLRGIGRAGKGLVSADWFYRARRDRRRTALGFTQFLQGRWEEAQHNLLRGAKFSDTQALNYLGAAIASHRAGDRQQSEACLQRAEAAGDTDSAALIKVRLYLQERDYPRALAQLQQLQKHHPSHKAVLGLLVAARKGLADWDGLRRMLPELKRHKVFNDQEYDDLQQRVFVEVLQREPVATVWPEVPPALKKKPALIAAYVSGLPPDEQVVAGEKVLRKAIKNQWDRQLVTLYAKIRGGDPIQRLHTAESWLESHPEDPVLLAALGELSLQAELWGKARDYFNTSLAKEPQPHVFEALGKLLAQLGDEQQSAECYRQGLQLAVTRIGS